MSSGFRDDLEDDDVLEGIAEDEPDIPLPKDVHRSMSDLSMKVASVEQPPSANEIRLGKRLLELERERDELVAQVVLLKAKDKAPESTTVLVPEGVSGSLSGPGENIIIPQELIPTLSILRQHITDLTRDNDALRYTFLSSPLHPESKPAKDAVAVAESAPSSSTHSYGMPRGVKLEEVVQRVRELIKENEELGDMVIEAGQAGVEEWEQALEESKSVITSLEVELQSQLETMQRVQSDLKAYQKHFGSLPKGPTSTAPSSVSGTSHSVSIQRPRHSHGREHDGDRDRDRDRERGGSRAGEFGQGQGKGRHQERDKRWDREREGGSGQGDKDTRNNGTFKRRR